MLAVALVAVTFVVASGLQLRFGTDGAPDVRADKGAFYARKPNKPNLSLTFQGTFNSSQAGVQTLTANYSLFAISVFDGALSENDPDKPRDGIVMDLVRGTQFMHQRFFKEVVCYKSEIEPSQVSGAQPLYRTIDENNTTNETASNSTEYLDASYRYILEQILEAPIRMYDKADHFMGKRRIAGQSCWLWGFNLNETSPVEDYLLASIAGGFGLDALSSTDIQDAADNLNTTEPPEVLYQQNTTFCVTSEGHLLSSSSNVSLTLIVAKNNTNTTAPQAPIRQMLHEASTWNNAIAPMQGKTAPSRLSGEHGVTGGRCIDLTPGHVGKAELKFKLNSAERLERINREAAGLWQAGRYDFWNGVEVRDIVPSLGTQMGPLRLPLKGQALQQFGGQHGLALLSQSAPTPPKDFDSRSHWPKCRSIGLVRNQGMCGSCWAFAASAVLQDRFCVERSNANFTSRVLKSDYSSTANEHSKTHNTTSSPSSYMQLDSVTGLTLAPMFLVDCDTTNSGCEGGRLDDAWWYLRKHGVAAESCSPYKYCPLPAARKCSYGSSKAPLPSEMPSLEVQGAGKPQQCTGKCADGKPVKLYRAAFAFAVAPPGDVRGMQQEMMMHGPMEVGFFVFSDFTSYHRGVYSRTPGAYGPLGGHAVRMVGWGTAKYKGKPDVDYWMVANSWSPSWGMGGFFRIVRGTNECGIETTPAAGLPKLEDLGGVAPKSQVRPKVRPAHVSHDSFARKPVYARGRLAKLTKGSYWTF